MYFTPNSCLNVFRKVATGMMNFTKNFYRTSDINFFFHYLHFYFSLVDEYYTWFSGCSGREQCITIGAQIVSTSADACGAGYLDIFGPFTQYLYMDYYCIEC